MSEPAEWAAPTVPLAPWWRVPSYFETRPAQAFALGAALVGLGVWMLLRAQGRDFEDPYADPLGTGYPPNLPPDFAPSLTEEDAA